MAAISPNFAFPWLGALSTELVSLCGEQGIKIRSQHSQELIASCFGKPRASLIPADTLIPETPMIPDPINWDFVEQRIQKMLPDLAQNGGKEIILNALALIWFEETHESLAVIKRLVRNIAFNCEYDAAYGYSGSALLTFEDWSICGAVMGMDTFVDMLAEQLPWPSIMPIATAKPVPMYENRYQVEPGCVLNVLAFLLPQDWQAIMSRYQS